jgi:hypothetical protein
MKKTKSTTLSRLHFGATGWTIDFAGCDAILAAYCRISRGWKLKLTAPRTKTPKSLRATVKKNRTGWTWTSHKSFKPREWDKIPPRTEMRVVNDLQDVAIYWHLWDNSELLCLHCAAAKFGDHLVCFPSRHRAGKSTLMATLASLNQRIFGDDVLILKRGRGVSFGFMPRLRMPLAPTLPPQVLDYIAAHDAYSNDKWTYLAPPKTNMAEFGESAPFQAFVMLRRETGAAAVLLPSRTVDVLRALVAENIVRLLPLPTIFTRLHRLAKKYPKYELVYDNPVEAAQLLIKTFGRP